MRLILSLSLHYICITNELLQAPFPSGYGWGILAHALACNPGGLHHNRWNIYVNSLLIKNGRVVDPASGRDAVGDVFVSDGKIAEEASAERVIDARGLVVAPGFVDLSARLREPGQEYKATLESEMDAAVAGGVTSLACPPDTDPPLDEPGLVDMLRRRAKALSRARVYPVGALTVKLQGQALTEMGQLADAGCVAFSQANAPLADTQVLWRALQYAATFGYPVWLRAEDTWLARGGVAHDGEVATRLGLPAIPPFAETIALATLLELVPLLLAALLELLIWALVCGSPPAPGPGPLLWSPPLPLGPGSTHTPL